MNKYYENLSKTKQLEFSLIDEIKQKKAKPHDKFLSEREIIEKYNINQTTVRQTLVRLVQQGYLYRINGKGTFVAPKPKTSPILLVSKYDNQTLLNGKYSYIQFLMGLNVGISENDLPLIPVTLHYKEYLEIIDDIELIYKGITGIIFFSEISPYLETKEILQNKRIPAVYYGADQNITENEDVNKYVYDQKELVYTALNELYKNGHKKIGIIYSKHRTQREQRYSLYKKWHEEKNLPIDENNHIEIYYKDSEKSVRDSTEFNNRIKKINLKKIATAYFCVDDFLAQFFINTTFKIGYKIPEDFSVVSINNYPFCHQVIVPLCSVAIPFAEDAIKCAIKLSDLSNNIISTINEKSISSIKIRESIKPI